MAPLILCSSHHNPPDLQRDISHVLLKSGPPIPPQLSLQQCPWRYPKASLQQTQAQSHGKLSPGLGEDVPWGCTQYPWPRGRRWGKWCSELIPGRTSSAIVTQTLSTDLLAQDHPRWLLPQGALRPDTLSWPIYQQDWGKTSWWNYAPMVSTRLLIFQTSTSILK